MLFKEKKYVLSFLYVLHCHTHEDSFFIPSVYLKLTSFLLSLDLKNHPHVTCKSWEIKTNLIVSWEVTEGRSVNLCTQFFSSTKSWKRQYLNFNGHRIMQYLSFNYPRNFLKHQFDALQEKVSISWAVELLLSLGLEMVSWLKYCTPSPHWGLASGRTSGGNALPHLNLRNDKKYWQAEPHKWDLSFSKWICYAR